MFFDLKTNKQKNNNIIAHAEAVSETELVDCVDTHLWASLDSQGKFIL